MAGNRKDELKALFAGGLTSNPVPAVDSKPAAGEAGAPQAPSARAASGAVKAMGLTLGSMTKDAEEARLLRQALQEGERIIAVAPEKIEASFVEDRIHLADQEDEDFASLLESMRESGQQVPVLLRPHPQKPGHFQTAYGHRRIRAATQLGLEVKAIVRSLTDDELVLAQGKENAERRNLSFIERAIFARNLAARGFERKVIGDALSVQKSELSRLMQVVEAVPERFIRLIGSAPKAGRDRWMKLGELLQVADQLARAEREIETEAFRQAGSDQRFQMLFDSLSRVPKSDPKPAVDLKGADGEVFARIRSDGRSTKVEFANGLENAFIEDAMSALIESYDRFSKTRGKA